MYGKELITYTLPSMRYLKFEPASGAKVKSWKWTFSPTPACGSSEKRRETNRDRSTIRISLRTNIRRGQPRFFPGKIFVKILCIYFICDRWLERDGYLGEEINTHKYQQQCVSQDFSHYTNKANTIN